MKARAGMLVVAKDLFFGVEEIFFGVRQVSLVVRCFLRGCQLVELVVGWMFSGKLGCVKRYSFEI